MARRKNEDSNIRSLTKAGGASYAVTIPIEFIRKLKWKEKQKLELKVYQDRIVIKDWRLTPHSTPHSGEVIPFSL